PRGMRYADFTQNPSNGFVTALIDVTCFIQYVPVQPGTTIRAGKPFQCGSGAPFISYATKVFSSSAFHAGIDLTKSGVPGITAVSAPSNTISTASLRMPA